MTTAHITYWVVTLLLFGALFVLARNLKMKLWARVLIGLGLGGVMGFVFGGGAAGCAESAGCVPVSTKFLGDAFVRLIRMLIVPLIFTTLTAGVIAMGDPKRLGSLGARTIGMYMGTTIIAVSLGLLFGTLFQPGVGVDLSTVDLSSIDSVKGIIATGDAAGGIVDRLLAIIPENPVAALATTNVLAIIFWAILFGTGILLAGDAAKPVAKVIEASAEAVLKVTEIIMEVAPYGVYALMAWVISTQGLDILVNLGKLTLALYLACFLHIIITYGSIIKFINKLPVKRFFGGIVDAQAVAYSTDSSNATLPVTIANVTDNLGVDKSVSGSVLPLGATINMDGTAIYLGLVALFASQALDIPLDATHYFMIALTATLASIGAAGIPSAGLLLAATVLSVFGVTAEQSVLIIALIFPFDRLLDMMRTVTNVSGDAAVAVTVAKWEGALDEEVFKAKPVA
ncbi:MAG: dicarboxylate/amino acid:cation symporter [Alphaproteobacteria bacterium]|nr:dicarboxylate/amino acid:cation symporter [Alphaproteobacteria bacterium]